MTLCVCVRAAYTCVFPSRTKRPGSSVALRAFTVVSVKSLTGHTTLRTEQNKQNKLEWKKIRKVKRRGEKKGKLFFHFSLNFGAIVSHGKTKRFLSEIMTRVERKWRRRLKRYCCGVISDKCFLSLSLTSGQQFPVRGPVFCRVTGDSGSAFQVPRNHCKGTAT